MPKKVGKGRARIGKGKREQRKEKKREDEEKRWLEGSKGRDEVKEKRNQKKRRGQAKGSGCVNQRNCSCHIPAVYVVGRASPHPQDLIDSLTVYNHPFLC